MGLASVFENHARLTTQAGRSSDFVIAAPMATRCTRKPVASVTPLAGHASGLREGCFLVRKNIRVIKAGSYGVRAIQVSHDAPDRDISLFQPSYGVTAAPCHHAIRYLLLPKTSNQPLSRSSN
jgi:hypothetical protein